MKKKKIMFKDAHRFVSWLHDLRGGIRNNGKGKTIKLTKEIVETNRLLGESSNYQLENRIEQAVPSYIETENCRIM